MGVREARGLGIRVAWTANPRDIVRIQGPFLELILDVHKTFAGDPP